MYKMQYFFDFFQKCIDIFLKGVIIRIMMYQIHRTKTTKGGDKMTNQELLEQKIEQSGKKKGYLAKKCGLSRQGFKNCVTGDAFFNASHIKILCAELNITSLKEKEAIFFA
jgi:hypothetical protein